MFMIVLVFSYQYGNLSNKLNKIYFFLFGLEILVDDYILNDDLCVFCNLNSCGKTQSIFNCCCGYFCEAVINLLLCNKIFRNNENAMKPGKEVRHFLKKILSNKNVKSKYKYLRLIV